MAYCPECGTEVSADTTFCPDCGTNLTDGDGPKDADPAETDDSDGGGLTAKIPLMKPGHRIRNVSVAFIYVVLIMAVLSAGVPEDNGADANGGNGGDAAPATEELGVQVRIIYDGEWQGSVGSGGSQRSVDGTGEETLDVDDDATIVSANAQKLDGSSDELTIQILVDGDVVAEQSTTAANGVAQVSETV